MFHPQMPDTERAATRGSKHADPLSLRCGWCGPQFGCSEAATVHSRHGPFLRKRRTPRQRGEPPGRSTWVSTTMQVEPGCRGLAITCDKVAGRPSVDLLVLPNRIGSRCRFDLSPLPKGTRDADPPYEEGSSSDSQCDCERKRPRVAIGQLLSGDTSTHRTTALYRQRERRDSTFAEHGVGGAHPS
jgi:hypothetical protein